MLKILAIDDHALVREGLSQVLKGLDDHVEVLQAATCERGFALAQEHSDLDLVLLDYQLPDMTGLTALKIFGQRHPELPILMLSGSANLQIMQQVMQAGAAGFVTKSSVSDELLSAVRQVLAGEACSTPDFATLCSNYEDLASVDRPALTQRQGLVLRELLDGRSNREISKVIGISEETVKTHVTAVLRHFGAQNRTQAVVAAARFGFKPATSI
jgi:DNA-binding NarL/FixJ family response regulator